MTEDYRVQLDVYNGPLDLLLYLIKREEVDIYDIPIARITEQYVQYVEMLQQVDPNLAGDFLVLAATLIEIKTRMLLPTPPAEDGDEQLSDLDPRAELVRQLLQYKAFKDAAADLESAAVEREKRHPRRPPEPDLPAPPDRSLEDVQVWDLFDAFARLLESIGAAETTHQVIYDDTPVHVHAEDLLERLAAEGPIRFESVFAPATSRTERIGMFLAVLELCRQNRILAVQGDNFGQIQLELNPDPPAEQPEPADEPAEGPVG
jgi:segregation and condensation protein A